MVQLQAQVSDIITPHLKKYKVSEHGQIFFVTDQDSFTLQEFYLVEPLVAFPALPSSYFLETLDDSVKTTLLYQALFHVLRSKFLYSKQALYILPVFLKLCIDFKQAGYSSVSDDDYLTILSSDNPDLINKLVELVSLKDLAQQYLSVNAILQYMNEIEKVNSLNQALVVLEEIYRF